jgi:hypothetical protein
MTTMTPVAPPPPTQPGTRPRNGGNPLTKLTVNITSKGTAALEEAAELNAESKTNAVNRAIQAYAFISRMMAEGWELVLRDPEGKREQRVQFL